MTPGQTRVLVLLLVLLSLEIFLNPGTGQQISDLVSGRQSGQIASGAFMAFAGYTAGAFALLALAAVADGIATGIVLLLILLVVLSHSSQVVGLIQGATGTLPVGGGSK